MRNTILIIIILAVLVAVVTEPDQKDFETWLAKKEGINLKPVIRRTNSFGFSIYDADYYGLLKKDSSGSGQKWAPGQIRKDKYLGLFGTFWKL